MNTLVENCFKLSIKILRKTLQKARNGEPVNGEYINFLHNGRPSVLDYSIEYESDNNACLLVNFNGEPQKIELANHDLHFGARTYLICACGKRTNALYLKNTFFACFKCHKLRYRSTTINHRSDHGRMLYQQNKRLQLIDMRESISRPLYRSKWTKRFSRFIKLCDKAGLFNQVKDAQTTMEAIKTFQSQ